MSRRPPARRAARARRRATLLLAWAVLGAVLGTVGTVAPAPLPAGATPVPSTSVGVGRVGVYPEIPVGPVVPVGTPPSIMPWYSDRDCGFSAPTLNRLARLYVFCDTTVQDALGTPRQAIWPSNTLALTPDPLFGPPKPRDALYLNSSIGESIPFPAAVTCPAGYTERVWPHSVATLPDYDGNPTTDRFAVYFRAYCNLGWDFDGRGVGVAFVDTDTDLPHTHYPVDPGDPDQYRYPISGLVESGTHDWTTSTGANVVQTTSGRHMYLYRCDGAHAAGGGCYVRRIALTGSKSGDATALGTGSYQMLRVDDTWGTTGTPKRLTDATGAHDPPATRDPLYEPTLATIAWVPDLGKFVMTYNYNGRPPASPDFQATGYFGVMTAASIIGPWSEPVEVAVPAGACTVENTLCYQAAAQPGLTNRDRLGYTFRDQSMVRRPLGTDVGTLRAASIPLSVLGPAEDESTPTNAAYVDWLYRHVLNRIGLPADITYWAGWLTTHTRAALVDQFVDSTEFKRAWVRRIVYDVWQYRRLTTDETNALVTTWGSGTFEAFERAVAASDDTYLRITGSVTPTSTRNKVWLHHLYQAALNGPPDASGFAYWLDRLDAGTATRSYVAGNLLQSTASRNVRVQMIFNLLVRRTASAGDLGFYGPRYAGTGSLQQLITDIGASLEAYTEAGRDRSLPLE